MRLIEVGVAAVEQTPPIAKPAALTPIGKQAFKTIRSTQLLAACQKILIVIAELILPVPPCRQRNEQQQHTRHIENPQLAKLCLLSAAPKGPLFGAQSQKKPGTSLLKSCHVGAGNLSLAGRVGAQVGDEEKFLQLEPGRDHLVCRTRSDNTCRSVPLV